MSISSAHPISTIHESGHPSSSRIAYGPPATPSTSQSNVYALTMPQVSATTSPDSQGAYDSHLRSLRRQPLPPSSGHSLLAYDNPSSDDMHEPTAYTRPHPHAPRAPERELSAGPAILRDQTRSPQSYTPQKGTSHNTLRMAAAAGGQLQGSFYGRTTIHGQTTTDLLSASGPVPISFALDQYQAAMMPPPVGPDERFGALMDGLHARPPILRQVSSPTPAENGPASHPLPRESFAPSVGKPRPRSRSFSNVHPDDFLPNPSSDFRRPFSSKETSTASLPTSPVSAAFAHDPGRNQSAGLGQAAEILGSLQPRKRSQARRERPSPLHPASPTSSHQRYPSPVSSPASQYHPASLSVELSSPPHSPNPSSSSSFSRYEPDSPDSKRSSSTRTSSYPYLQKESPNNESTETFHDDILDAYSSSPPREPINLPSEQTSSSVPFPNTSTTSLASTSTLPSQSAYARSHNSVTPSLHSKISMPALRQSTRRTTARSVTGPHPETIQVQDMEFEIIKPPVTINTHRTPSISSLRTGRSIGQASHDEGPAESVYSYRSKLTIPTEETNADLQSSPVSPTSTNLLSPMDTASTFGGISLSGNSNISGANSLISTSDSLANRVVGGRSLESHRQLELKWVSIRDSVPSAEAKKSRKIRKLVIDGIPTSVRGMVWLYLTDSKGRQMPGLYGQLSKRRKATISDLIVADTQKYFPDDAAYGTPNGPLVSLLQAYLSMVPDTEYHYGLTLVAGHILQQTHEEDAFWIFVSKMDTHRVYFSPTVRYLSIDTSLFEKAVAAFDQPLANRLFTELRLSSFDVCRHWFPSLFAGVFPPSHLYRIWDFIMLYDGPTFLIRLGLAVLSFCRAYLLNRNQCRDASDALTYLLHPPWNVLPAEPDAVVTTAMAAKLKEDDIRKTRAKLEAQMKKQMSASRPTFGSSR